MNPFISLRQASFRLGESLVFEGTSWRFERNQQWAIIGPNGSGKSLLADALRGRLPLVGGELRYHFNPPPGLSHEDAIGHVSFEERKHGAAEFVAQSRWDSLEEEAALRVGQFLGYEKVMEINPFEVSRPDAAARATFARRRQHAIRLLRLEPFLDRSLLSLSNGETQRAQLARALCLPLRLLILDEPFAGLDAAMRKHFGRALERLMQTSLRVVMITTRPEDLPRHITHWLQVENCRVVAAGPRPSRRASLRLAAPPPASRAAESTRPRPRSNPLRLTEPRSARPPAPTPPSRVPPLTFRLSRFTHPGAGRVLVELRNVTVRYGRKTVFENVNWTVRAGESWALLGPNGSGKTTLLSLIQGDHPQAYANDVTVFGRCRGEGESIWELKRRIGWLSPELHLHFDDSATCQEVVASGFFDTIGLFEQPTAAQRRAARKRLAQFGLLEHARTPLFALSAGRQRMVLLARALVKDPELLILDEPCQGLDVAHRRLLVQTVDALNRSGAATLLYVTHRPDEIPPSIRQVLPLR